MFHYLNRIQDQNGNSIPDWQVEVVDLADGSTVIPIYADENLTPIATVSGVANRAVSDALGNYDFFVPDGKYSLRIYNADGVFQDTLRYLTMYGNAEEVVQDAVTDAQQAVTDAQTQVTLATAEKDASVTARTGAETAQALSEAARDVATNLGNAPLYAALADLPTADGTQGWAVIPTGSDEGLYEDTGSWTRQGDTQAVRAEDAVADATAQAVLAMGYADSIDPGYTFPGTRNFYGPIYGPSPRFFGSGPSLSRDGLITIPAGTSNAYQYSTIASVDVPVIPGDNFCSTIEVVSGTIGTRTLTLGGAKTYVNDGDNWTWEGVVPATPGSWSTRINNGSATEPLVIRHRWATGPASASAATPQANATAMDAFFANGAIPTDANRVNIDRIDIGGNDSNENTVVTDNSGFVIGDRAHVLFYAETVDGRAGVLAQAVLRVTAGNSVSYEAAPVADQPGWWYADVYFDPAELTGTEITALDFRINNAISSTTIPEEACWVSVFLFEDPLPDFDRNETERATIGKGLRSVGVMGQNYSFLTSANNGFIGYNEPLDGRVSRVYTHAVAAGTQTIGRLERLTGAFLSDPVTFDHPGGGWHPVDLPIEWREARKNQVIGVGTGLTGTPTNWSYATGNVPFSSWFTSNKDGTVAPVPANFFNGIWYEIEDDHGIVSRFGDGTNEPLSYIAIWVIGQSNESGYGDRFSDIAASGSYMWNRREGSILALSDPTGPDLVGANAQFQQGGSRFPALADAISRASNGRVGLLVINSADPASAISDWGGTSTNWTTAVADWNGALDAAHAADLPIIGCGIVGFMGESDGVSSTSKSVFKTGILDLVARARAVASPKTPVFVRPIGQSFTGEYDTGLGVIREAYGELVNENERFYMAYPASYTARERGAMRDIFHFFQEEQDAIGETMAPIVLANAPQAVPLNYTLGVART